MNEAHTPVESRARPLRPWLQTHWGEEKSRGLGGRHGLIHPTNTRQRVVIEADSGQTPHGSLLLLNLPADGTGWVQAKHFYGDLFKLPAAFLLICLLRMGFVRHKKMHKICIVSG